MKKIGIVGWKTGENSFGATIPYMNWLSKFGTVHILSPQKQIVKDLDLLILPGGADISPQSFDEIPGFHTSNTDVMKQYFFDYNLDQYLLNNTPIFGICLGFQQLCVKFGGKLVQHYPFNYSSKGRFEQVDTLIINSDFLKQFNLDLFNNKEYKVNSLHHQGCFSLPDSANVVAKEKTDGNIEIAKFAENVYGVQYHPEEINDLISELIIKKLLNLEYNEIS